MDAMYVPVWKLGCSNPQIDIVPTSIKIPKWSLGWEKTDSA
jgi:hypothetical protein